MRGAERPNLLVATGDRRGGASRPELGGSVSGLGLPPLLRVMSLSEQSEADLRVDPVRPVSFQVGVGRRPGMPSAAPCQPKCCARRLAASCAESRLPPVVPDKPPAAPGRPGPATAANAPTPRAGRRTHWPARCSPCRWRLPSAHGAPSWSKGMRPLPLGTLPPSGSTHRWFPAVVTRPPISVSKMPSSCTNLVGAAGIEPATPRL